MKADNIHRDSRQLEKWAESMVKDVQAKLPSELAALANMVPVSLARTPDPETVREMGEDLLGLFEGESHGEEGSTTGAAPPRIWLYLDNLWELTRPDAVAFREEVRITYLHEFGHYLGWDEFEVEARGLF